MDWATKYVLIVRALESSYKQVNGLWVNERWDYALPDRQLAAAHVHSNEGRSYLEAMNAAANFAFANRAVLAERLQTVLKLRWALTVKREHSTTSPTTSQKWKRTPCTAVHTRVVSTGKVQHGHSVATILMSGNSFPPRGNLLSSRRYGERFVDHGRLSERSSIAFGSSCHGAGRALSRSQAKKTRWKGLETPT